MPSKNKEKSGSLNEKLINEEGIHNPMLESEASPKRGYSPPDSPRSIAVDLEEIEPGYVLTKAEAESTMIVEPKSGVPMPLLDFYVHAISQELYLRQTKGPYARDAKDLARLNQQIQTAGPETDIKLLIRTFLNQRDLSSNCVTQEDFWNDIRASLNATLKFQPSMAKPVETFAQSQRKASLWEKLGRSSPELKNRFEPGSTEDVQNATSKAIKEERHKVVENQIKMYTAKQGVSDLKQPNATHSSTMRPGK